MDDRTRKLLKTVRETAERLGRRATIMARKNEDSLGQAVLPYQVWEIKDLRDMIDNLTAAYRDMVEA